MIDKDNELIKLILKKTDNISKLLETENSEPMEIDRKINNNDILIEITSKLDWITNNINESKKSSYNANNAYLQSEEYSNLEKVLQKYEAEIRDHIRLEQQLKIYTEGLEEKLNKFNNERNDEEISSLLKENKKLLNKINDLKKDKENLKKIIDKKSKKGKNNVKRVSDKIVSKNIISLNQINNDIGNNLSTKDMNKKIIFSKKSKSKPKPNLKNKSKNKNCNFKLLFANAQIKQKNENSILNKNKGLSIFKHKFLNKK